MVRIFVTNLSVNLERHDGSREAWVRCRAMSKEQAMQEYLDEIRKVIVTH